ncbi:FprA family A-type flavoprotein [Alkaliphilus oremlandii]|uniref:Flavodoxin/nitric oxide synthase n=1 Tax=Alkaliphilus oremlandii (strain OhILAs) TaxID=350688 RepID=A8MI56_ALKOO|nr:flavodoxin domain-containing protein [Alkaliphilus oremlandii]ABW19488.1 flavodoxin/nitric oxide synthase [Alkaliphilus oremlandii OhILAs]
MSAVEIKKGIYWVGAVDWNIREFHGPSYHTRRGTSYNSYLIVDEKITLVDIVDADFADVMLDNIREIIDPSKIDYIVVNHIEPDHSGSFPKLMEVATNAKVFCTQKGKDGMLQHYFGNYDYNIVKTGAVLNLGARNIKFIEAPMLHWPDSMFSYIEEESLLLPNDAFGQHVASTKLFDDENDMCILMEEAKRYYANILMPFSGMVVRKIEELVKMGLKIDMIAPSHGVIWRSNPDKIIEKYMEWGRGLSSKKAVIAYETMWSSTEKMARKIIEGLASEGIDTKLYKISKSDVNDIMTDILDAKAVLVASSTINNTMIPDVAYFLEELIGLRPLKKVGAAFGSYGWGKGAVANIEKRMNDAGVSLIKEGLQIKFVPTEEDLNACYEFGREIGKMLE